MLKNLKIFIMLLPFMTLMTAHSLTLAADVTRTENNKEANAGTLVFHVQVGEYNLIQEAIQNQIRLNSLGIRTGVIRANEGSTIRLVVMNTERSIAFNRDTASSMIDFLKKINIDAKLIAAKVENDRSQILTQLREQESTSQNSTKSNSRENSVFDSANPKSQDNAQQILGRCIKSVLFKGENTVNIEFKNNTFYASIGDILSSPEEIEKCIILSRGNDIEGISQLIKQAFNSQLFGYGIKKENEEVLLICPESRKGEGRPICDQGVVDSLRKWSNDYFSRVQIKAQANKQLALKAQQDAAVAEEGRRRAAEREAVQREKQRIERERERCLSDGPIGICQSASQNNTQFICDRNSLTTLDNIFNRYCYVTDRFNIVTKMEVRNNLQKPVKDINFRCAQIAKSGTILRENISTIFDIWNPGEVKMISLSFIKHDQVESMRCISSSWK